MVYDLINYIPFGFWLIMIILGALLTPTTMYLVISNWIRKNRLKIRYNQIRDVLQIKTLELLNHYKHEADNPSAGNIAEMLESDISKLEQEMVVLDWIMRPRRR